MANQTLKPFNGELDPVEDAPAGLKPFTGTLDGEKPQRTLAQAAKDTGAQLAEGVNTTLGAIPSVVAPQSRAAGFFRDNAQYWRDQQSDVLKNRIAETDRRIEEAGKDGLLSQIGTAASEYWNDPAQAARLVATNLPSMAATLGTGAVAGLAARGVAAARGLDAAGKAALAAKYGTTTAAATNAALNAGGARGEAFEDLQKTALAQGMTPEQAEQAGVTGSILPGVVGGVAGAISGKIGLEKAILGQATTGAAMRKAAGAFGAELAGEQIEELAPKVATNYQAGRIDAARGLTDGLGRTMVETAIGSGPGAIVAGGAAGIRDGEQPSGAPAPSDPTTSPGAADPNAPASSPATPPEAPDLTTAPGAGVSRDGVDFTREVDTSGLSLQDPAELERQRAATVDYQPVDTTPQWDTQPGAAQSRDGLNMPGPEFDTGSLGFDTRAPSERMGLDPAKGSLTRIAALAVDTGASPVQFLGATGRDMQLRQTGPGVANESNVIDVQGRVIEDRAIGTPRRLTAQDGARESGAIAFQDGVSRSEIAAIPNIVARAEQLRGYDEAAQKAAQPLALPTPSNLREGLERIRAQREQAARTAQVPPTTGATSVPQANQAQQAVSQQPQAGGQAIAGPAAPAAAQPAAFGGSGVQAAGLTNGAPTQNTGAQSSTAAGAQGQAPQTAVARPDGWRKSMLRAAPIARAMGIDPKGKRLAQVLAEIDARDTRTPAPPAPQPAPGPVRIGRDNTPLNEGGKPFKTRKAAGDAKKLQPMMRVVTVPGGFALADKTPAQLAAEARAARRLAQPRTGTAGAPLAAHEFIAAEGGLSSVAAADLGVDGNPRIGNRRLFAGRGRGMSMERATEKLIAEGYLGEGATLNDAYDLIKLSLSRPQYNADGYERIAEAEVQTQFEDYLAAQEESAQEDDGFDPFGLPPELTAEDLAAEGYTTADPALQAEVNALVAQAEAAGIDTYDVLDDIVRTYANATQDQYNAAAREALAAAIARSNQDGGGLTTAVAPAPTRSEPEQGLDQPEAPANQAQEATENVASEALELTALSPVQAAAQQDAQEQAAKAEAAAKRAEDAAAKAEDERKRIAQASVRAADTFELGQDPLDSLTGQGSMFDDAPAQQAPTATETVAQPITRADVTAAQQQATTLIAERLDAMTAGEVNTIARRFLPTMGVKPTVSKERNKAAVTDFTKVNQIAAADEFGVTLPADVRRALEAEMQGKVVEAGPADAPNPLDYTPKQYADAWLRWVAESNGLPLSEVREMQGDEAGLKSIEQRWVDAAVQEAKSGNPLPSKTLDKLLEVRPNAQLPESAIPAGYQRSQARKQEADEKQARADNRKKVKQGAGEAPPVTDFGQKLEGARKDMPPSLKEEVSDEKIASLPLSKIWPSDAHESIEDDAAAALVFAARQEIPAKPRVPSRVRAWASKVKTYRTLVKDLGKNSLERIEQLSKEKGFHSLDQFFAKVRLLSQLPRDTWSRVERVEEYPNAIRYEKDGSKTAVAFSSVTIDGKSRRFEGVGKIGPDEVQAVKEMLGTAAPKKDGLTAQDFEVRGTAKTGYKINRKGDSEYRSLKIFTGEDAAKKALAWRDEHTAELEAAWEAVKARDNVSKAEVRRDENRERTGENRRNGRDVTAEMFTDAFGFRGGQFGNWVGQGADAKSRQGMLNDAYDALLDLSDILGIPSRAISLNGTLGLSFGARGSGKAAAHFEPSNLVINLTKTRGAGSLAHEWFHALDNYFSRMRGGEVAFTGDNNAYRQNNFVTYKPEAAWGKAPITPYTNFMRGGQLRERLQRLPGFTYDANKTLAENAKAAGFERDPNHKDGVRPQVEKAFADLVQALNESPMAKRASSLDKAADGYWGRIIERGARSFENYVISKMAQRGWSNDFLANIRSFDEWMAMGKNAERYPYLKPEEDAPVVEAFDKLFETVESRETEDGKVVLFSRRSASGNRLPDVVIGHKLGTLSSHPDYEAAKAGDSMAAARIASDLVDGAMIEAVRQAAGNAELIVPVVSVEATGRNKIPLAVARELADRLGSTAETEIVQADSPKRTNMDGLSRLLNPPVFDGPVIQGAAYVLVDDTVTQGGTFASLASHIRDNGGDVAGVVALTGKQYSAKLEPSPELLQQVRDRFQSVEPAFRSATGYGFDALTESEARYLVKHDDAESVRNRILAAGSERINGGDRGLPETTPRSQGQERTDSVSPRTPAATIRAAITKAYGKLLGQLESKGLVTLTQAQEQAIEAAARARADKTGGDVAQIKRSLNAAMQGGTDLDIKRSANGSIQGFFDPQTGQSFLIADNLTAEAAPGVLMHEVGIHMAADGSMKALFNRAAMMLKLQKGNPFMKAVQARMDAAGETSGEEAAAYIAEAYENDRANAPASVRRWLADLLAAVKAWMFKKGIVGADRLTVADIAAVARANARSMAQGDAMGSGGAADIQFSRAASPSQPAAWDAPVPTGFDDVIYKLQDKNIDLKRVVEAITKSVGKVSDSINAYLKEELFHKRAAKRVADFGARELKPLMNQMRLTGLSMEDVEEYLHARHAKEANAVIAQRNPGEPGLQDGGSGMTNAAADNYFAKLDPAQRRKLESVAAKVDAIIADTRKLYVSYGLEEQAVVDGWANMYQHYIPLMREDKDGGMGTGQGFSVKGKETKGRTGSTRKVVDILANVAMQREKLIVRGEKNIVAQALVGLAQANPNPDFWEVRSQAPTERVFDPKTGVVVDRPDPLFKSRENVAVAKVKDANGKVTEQMVVFNEDNPRAVRMAAAMKNLDAGNLEGLLGVSAKITRYFAAINTQYNPVFGVVNLVRDVQGAMVNLGTTPLAGQQGKIAKDTLSALRGIYGDIRKTRKGGQATSQWSQLWEQMQDDGGTTGYRDLFKTSADRANDLKSILNPEGWMDSKWGKFFTADGRLKVPLSMAQKGATEIFGWLSDYNEAMENGVRLAAYKAALDKGMSREQAASIAKNLTVNFNRKGQVGQQAGAVYAFFNAAMQGTARIGQTLFDMDGGDISTLRLSKTGKAVVYGGVTLGAIQALALAAAGFDAEDPPEFVRERSLIIPTGDKTYVSIPMPLGLHVIPGIGRHATEFALSGFDKPAKRAVSMVGMFADAFNPIGNAGLSMQTIAPTALDPLVALTENKDWTGKPIARVSSNKALPGHTQWKDTATGFSKLIAEAINWISGGNEYVAGAFSPTPDQIDYLLAQVGGGVAREAAKVQQTVSTALSGEELPTYKVPLLGRFAGNAASQASQGSAFYANLNRLNELETEIKGLRKDGKFDEAAKLMRNNPEAIMIAMANRAERDVQRLRREKRELIAKDASRYEVRAKEEQITAVMMRLNEAAARRKAAQ